MRVRRFDLDDLPAAHRLWVAAPGMTPPPRAEIERKLERDRDLFLVAEDADERVIGVVMGTYDGRRGWIFRLAVDTRRRGQGVGSALVGELEHRFAARGITKIRLLTFASNRPGRSFWAGLGYEESTDVVMFSKDLHAETTTDTC